MLRFKLNEEQAPIYNCTSFRELSSERSCSFNKIDAMFKCAIDCYRYPTHTNRSSQVFLSKSHIFVWNTKEIVDQAPVSVFWQFISYRSVFKLGLRNLFLTFLLLFSLGHFYYFPTYLLLDIYIRASLKST